MRSFIDLSIISREYFISIFNFSMQLQRQLNQNLLYNKDIKLFY